MIIVLNDREMEIKPGVRVEELIKDLNLAPESVVIEYNGAILGPDDYSQVLKEGSSLELIHLVGGG